MTGEQLRDVMGRLRLTYQDLADATPYSKQYIHELAKKSDKRLPEDAFRAIRSALLRISKDAASLYFDLTGEFCEPATAGGDAP
ncbi:MAG TPA: hypothetical protein PLJ35_05220 [Anaerolineae bacterium]|mgnify:CR=1 FL=1|nr:hypothetical protein [Anaerolineae bacterium]